MRFCRTTNTGRYAYDFLEEVRRKFGFAFFSSEYATNNDFADARDQRTPMGTILPFSGLKERALIDTKMLSEARIFVTQNAHPSLETWKLLPDSSVKIVEAGIIYATHAKNGNESGGAKSAESYQKSSPEEGLNDPTDLDALFVGPEVGVPLTYASLTRLWRVGWTPHVSTPQSMRYICLLGECSKGSFSRRSSFRPILPPRFWQRLQISLWKT